MNNVESQSNPIPPPEKKKSCSNKSSLIGAAIVIIFVTVPFTILKIMGILNFSGGTSLYRPITDAQKSWIRDTFNTYNYQGAINKMRSRCGSDGVLERNDEIACGEGKVNYCTCRGQTYHYNREDRSQDTWVYSIGRCPGMQCFCDTGKEMDYQRFESMIGADGYADLDKTLDLLCP